MAELLVLARDRKGYSYDRGDVIDIKPDGHEWGTEEGPPKFVIIEMPGRSVESLRHLMESEEEEDEEGLRDVIKLRRRGLRKAEVDAALRRPRGRLRLAREPRTANRTRRLRRPGG